MGGISLRRLPGGGAMLAPWLALAAPLLLTLLAAAACERRAGDLQADEVTYRLAAESLAGDFDWNFDSPDRQRLEALSMSAERLALLPGPDAGSRRFGVTAAYPLILAPFIRAAPDRGPAMLNGLLLAVAAIVAALRLEPRLGRLAPVLVALLVFGSVTYRYVFLVQPAVLLLAAVVIAASLAYRDEEPAAHGLRDLYRPPQAGAGFAGRWLLVGGLLGLVSLHHFLYALLLLPAAAAVQRARRRLGWSALGLGALLIVTAGLVAPGGLTLGSRLGPDPWQAPERGAVVQTDSPASVGPVTSRSPYEPAPGSLLPQRFSVNLTAWNLLYFAVGRNSGVLPYFLPLVALLGLWQGGSQRSILVVAALGGALSFVLWNPFDYHGGYAAVGNRWLLPFYGALWFVPTRALPRGWLLVTGILAAPLMLPSWLASSPDLTTPSGVYRHAAGSLHSWLPVETTLRSVPPTGQSYRGRFWVRSLSLGATVADSGRWRLEGGEPAELQLAASEALASLYLQFGSQAEPELEVRGGHLGDVVLLAEGGVGFQVVELRRRAYHPMWWSETKHHNYILRLRMPMAEPRSQTLSITAFAANLERAQP